MGRFRGVGMRLMGEFCESTTERGNKRLTMGDNSKNLRVQMGRCPVRSIFEEALPVLAKNQDRVRYVTLLLFLGDGG